MTDGRKSGEWMPPQADSYVNQGQFNAFLTDFRAFAADTKNALVKIGNDMAEGNTQFALVERDLGNASESLDGHSDKIRLLEDKEKIRAQREELMALQSQPRQYGVIATTAIQTVVGVLVVATLGYFYVSFMQTQKEISPPHSAPQGKTP